MRIIVLGASGMMGNTIFRLLSASRNLEVVGTTRSDESARLLASATAGTLDPTVDAERLDTVWRSLDTHRPEVVINCIGVVKQLQSATDPLVSIPLNALFPHQLDQACQVRGARLIHLSTDCVFDGTGSRYTESDPPNATDLYGRTKILGELNSSHAITLRTSTIGHELAGHHGLLEWFLAQSGSVRGFTRAIYSGITTLELATVIRDVVLPRTQLSGLFHVSGHIITKFDLLVAIGRIYQRATRIEPSGDLTIDRSLDSARFRTITGYAPPSWEQQIQAMRAFG